MLSDPLYLIIPGVLFSGSIIFPIVNFYKRRERQQYKARSPLLTINCLVFELICFWTIIVTSVLNYDEQTPTQMNVTQWLCPKENTVENLNRYVYANKFLLAGFTASKNSQILLFIFRCFRITCAYNINWDKYKKFTNFFVKEKYILVPVYLTWAAIFVAIYFFPYLSPFNFWMIEEYKSDIMQSVFSYIFTIYFTLCVFGLLYCLYLIDLTDQRFKIKYDIYMIIACFIFTNVFFFSLQSLNCTNATEYYFLGLNPYFWMVLILDLWVLTAVGYMVIYIDKKYQDEFFIIAHETIIESIQTFMLHKDELDYKRIFGQFLNHLATSSENSQQSSFMDDSKSENCLKKAYIIYDLYLDIIIMEINLKEHSEVQNMQPHHLLSANNVNNNETEIISQFQKIMNTFFTPSNQETYLGKLYGIDQSCRRFQEQLQNTDNSIVQISNILISQIINQTQLYMDQFFSEFKNTNSFHYIKTIISSNNIVSLRLATFQLLQFENN